MGALRLPIMPEFCTCGAELPPDARFCHRCGKPQREETALETVDLYQSLRVNRERRVEFVLHSKEPVEQPVQQ